MHELWLIPVARLISIRCSRNARHTTINNYSLYLQHATPYHSPSCPSCWRSCPSCCSATSFPASRRSSSRPMIYFNIFKWVKGINGATTHCHSEAQAVSSSSCAAHRPPIQGNGDVTSPALPLDRPGTQQPQLYFQNWHRITTKSKTSRQRIKLTETT